MVEEFLGNGRLSGVAVKNLETGESEVMHPGGVFVFIGLDPNTTFLEGATELDQWGFIKTFDNMQTSMEGVFASGDAHAGSTKQVASAVGEGAAAALMIRKYLEKFEGNRGYRGTKWWSERWKYLRFSLFRGALAASVHWSWQTG